MRIEPKDWRQGSFAVASQLLDLLREPRADYESLTDLERDRLRQTQAEAGETLRILGRSGDHALVMTADGVLGWVEARGLREDPALAGFPASRLGGQEASAFLLRWKGTPYHWGGNTRAGIDCSGFSQRYYREVLGKQIPRNSREQRRAGRSKPVAELGDHDLIFCHRVGGTGIHHVGIALGGDVWHARRDGGVGSQSLAEFLTQWEVEEVVSF